MRQTYRWSALSGACALSLCALSACGGGGGSSGGAAPQAEYNFSGGGTNVVSVSVGPGPAAASEQTFNIPFVTVTVCETGTSTCATVNDVLVDTGSSGLRLMASALAAQGVTLSAMPDPANSANSIYECLPFADGYAWGSVSTATVKVGAEATASAIPVQVIDDSATPSPAAPSSCTSYGKSLNSVDAFDANGVLGVATMIQDCGTACAQQALSVYYTCVAGGACTQTTQALAGQVSNPVAGFPADNNGVIVQLPRIAVSGAPTATGYLVFGIGTESNNGLGSATVFTTDSSGSFITKFESQTLSSSFIDSGSNGLYFPDSSLPLCGQSTPDSEFYCPTSTASLTATNQGQNGTTGSVSFQIANLKTVLNNNNYAYDDVGGPGAAIPGVSGYFDWGLPFFYDRTVFVAMDGASVGGTAGPFYAYR